MAQLGLVTSYLYRNLIRIRPAKNTLQIRFRVDPNNSGTPHSRESIEETNEEFDQRNVNYIRKRTKEQLTGEEFWKKNRQLNRPISPHLFIYKLQLTSTLSILNRATGLAASAALYTAGVGTLFCTSITFPEILELVQNNVPGSLIVMTKTALGGSVIYHTLSGIRHLVWDMGYGFQLKHLYLSGYIVVALTALGTGLIFIKA